MKKSILIFILCFCIVSKNEGLELSLDLNTPMSSGRRAVCGVLTCEESFKGNTSSGPTEDAPASRTISSMSVFKITQSKPAAANGNDNTDTLVASLSLDRPKITRVSNGVKVDGVLEAAQATLRLEMVKEVECSAQYSCEVRTSDGQGNEFVHINRLHQRPEKNQGQTNDDSISLVLIQHLTLLQQQMTLQGASLDDKLGDFETRMGRKFGELKAELDGKLATLESRLPDLESRLDTKFGIVNRKFGQLESSLGTLQSRLEDKILSARDKMEDKMESRVVDKLCQIEMKLSAFDGGERDFPQRLDGMEESITMLKAVMENENQKAIRLNALAISNSTSEIVAAVQGHMTEILNWEQQNRLRFDDLMAAKEKIVNSSEELSHRVQNDYTNFSKNLIGEFEKLQVSVLNASTETLSAVQHLIADTNTTMWSSLKPAFFDILSPKECKKGMFPTLLGTAFPYHVIQPNEKSDTNVPYLCDSVTEGGGWIVIQRRTSGTVDFYRNWAAYKEGFGSLTDDFWWGNDNIHALTSSGKYELRVDLKSNGESRFAHYSSFALDDESNNYVLRLGAYDGTAGDSLGFHSGKSFSTYDRDNDGRAQNDAETYKSAWWYYHGYHSNLNGVWGESGNNKAIRWNHFTSQGPVSFSEMKLRRL